MNNTVLAGFGIASGIINTVALVPYIRDIFRGKTKPERATWWVFLGLSGFALVGQIQAGTRWALLMTVANVLAAGIIAVCSIWFGYGRLHRRDWVSLGIAALGIGMAQVVNSSLLALVVVIGVDIAGFWLTVHKTWQAPHSETLISWVLATVSAGFGVAAVGKLNLAQLVYPVYILVSNGLLTYIIVARRPQVPRDATDDLRSPEARPGKLKTSKAPKAS